MRITHLSFCCRTSRWQFTRKITPVSSVDGSSLAAE